ncbi:hypothetical protein CDAR_504911 [Caerostris darwini]|uniref:Uncharacterized protein n=1 Tax=Caerostris darwini TaxID=1538125 RepID=A0AAV4MQF8_9ARAC|nr:hypothetical protein CDAR_504911 [Caerostris darwini]
MMLSIHSLINATDFPSDGFSGEWGEGGSVYLSRRNSILIVRGGRELCKKGGDPKGPVCAQRRVRYVRQKIFSAYPSSLKIVPIFSSPEQRFLPAAKRSSGVFGGWIIFRQMGHNKSSSRGGMRPGRGGNWGLPRRLERLQEGARGTFAQGEEMEKKGIHFKP